QSPRARSLAGLGVPRRDPRWPRLGDAHPRRRRLRWHLRDRRRPPRPVPVHVPGSLRPARHRPPRPQRRTGRRQTEDDLMSAEPEPKVTEAPVEDIALAGARATYRGKKLPAWVMPVIALVILGALGVLGLVTDMGMLTTLTSVLFYMVIAQGWNLLGGYGGYLNFGAAIFAGSGAYAAAWLANEWGWTMWQTFLPAGFAAVLVSLVLGYATLRLRSHYFAIFTIVFTFLAMVVVKNTPALGGSLGLYAFLDTDL